MSGTKTFSTEASERYARALFAVAEENNDIDHTEKNIIQLLNNAGATINYYDPYVPKLVYNQISLKSINKLEIDRIKNYDVCVIITDHSNIDYEIIHDNSQLIIDTRNVFKNKNSTHIKRLGQG